MTDEILTPGWSLDLNVAERSYPAQFIWCLPSSLTTTSAILSIYLESTIYSDPIALQALMLHFSEGILQFQAESGKNQFKTANSNIKPANFM